LPLSNLLDPEPLGKVNAAAAAAPVVAPSAE